MVSPPIWYVCTWVGVLGLYCAFWNDALGGSAWRTGVYGGIGIGFLCAVVWHQLK